MKIGALAVLWVVVTLCLFAMVVALASKVADEAPAMIGAAVAQGQVAYQKAHDEAMKGK